MGRNSKAKKFIDFKKDNILKQYNLQKKRPNAVNTEESKPTKNKPVLFQLREDLEREEQTAKEGDVQEINGDEEIVDNEEGEFNEFDLTENQDQPKNSYDFDNEFPDDGYDYSQHLRDPLEWDDEEEEAEVYFCSRGRKPQKTRAKQSQLPNTFAYEPPTNEACPTLVTDNGLSSDEEVSEEIIDDGEFANRFEDTEMIEPIIVTENDADIMEDEEDIYEAFFGAENIDENEEVCYDDMPPLEEEFSDDDLSMALSDDEEEEDMRSMESKFSRMAAPMPSSENMTEEQMNAFFDSMGTGVRRVETHGEVEMESSKGVHTETMASQAMNEKVNLMFEDFGNFNEDPTDYGSDAKMDIMSLTSETKCSKSDFMKSKVKVTGEETEQEKRDRLIAIEYSKRYMQMPDIPEYKEMTVPDPHSMSHNIFTTPSVRNRNIPKTIGSTLPSYFKQKESKTSLSKKDMEMHDKLQNVPKVNGEDDAMTYKTMMTELSYRPSDENCEERRERKKAFKEIKKCRREEKKANSLAHRHAIISAKKANINASICTKITLI